MVKDRLHLGDVASGADPKLFFGVSEILGLNLLHLVDGVVALLAPLQLLVEEVHHREVVRPDVVAPRQVDIVVGVERGEGYRAAEVDLAPLWQWLLGYLI